MLRRLVIKNFTGMIYVSPDMRNIMIVRRGIGNYNLFVSGILLAVNILWSYMMLSGIIHIISVTPLSGTGWLDNFNMILHGSLISYLHEGKKVQSQTILIIWQMCYNLRFHTALSAFAKVKISVNKAIIRCMFEIIQSIEKDACNCNIGLIYHVM